MRAAIFIDGGYFLQQIKNARFNPDYEKIPDHLLATIRKAVPVDLLRCYFYYCAPWMPQNPSEEALRRMEAHKAFEDELENMSRWQVRLGKLEKRWDGQKEYFEQKRVDVLLSIDLVRHATAGHIQHAILIAGDSDFIPAVQAAKEAGVVVSLWCGEQNTVHKDLVTLVDEVHNLDLTRFPRKLEKPAVPILAPSQSNPVRNEPRRTGTRPPNEPRVTREQPKPPPPRRTTPPATGVPADPPRPKPMSRGRRPKAQ